MGLEHQAMALERGDRRDLGRIGWRHQSRPIEIVEGVEEGPDLGPLPQEVVSALRDDVAHATRVQPASASGSVANQ